MRAFRRVSRGRTIPQQLDAELLCCARRGRDGLFRAVRGRGWLWLASLLLGGTLLLLRLRLIEPWLAGRAFGTASRLTRRGLRGWPRARR